MPFGAKDFCEGGEFSVVDIVYWMSIGVYRVAINGAQSLDGTGITASASNLHLKTMVALYTPGIIYDGIVASFNSRVADKTVEHVDDVGAGSC